MNASEKLLKAKTLLGLHDKATLKEIKLRYKKLMKQWHPDKHPDDVEKATQMSAKIIDAYKTLLEYTSNFEYPFDEKTIRDKYISPEEWWKNKFGPEGHNSI